MTKVIRFLSLTTPLPSILLRTVPSIADADAIIAKSAKIFLAKRTMTFIKVLANLPNKEPRNPPN